MPSPPGVVLINLGPELLAAARKVAAKKGIELTALVRESVATSIGKPDLATKVRGRGQPGIARTTVAVPENNTRR